MKFCLDTNPRNSPRTAFTRLKRRASTPRARFLTHHIHPLQANPANRKNHNPLLNKITIGDIDTLPGPSILQGEPWVQKSPLERAGNLDCTGQSFQQCIDPKTDWQMLLYPADDDLKQEEIIREYSRPGRLFPKDPV